MRPSGPAVGVGIACCAAGAALAGSHNPSISMVTRVNKARKRFEFILKIISGFDNQKEAMKMASF
jgi:hypothetical protein